MVLNLQVKQIQLSMQTIDFNGLHVEHICKPKLKNSYISIRKEGITLKTPKVSQVFINNLLHSKEAWMRRKLTEVQSRDYVNKNILDVNLAKNYMKERVEFYAQKMGLLYNELKFRRMKRRWGSCSSKRNITLNLYLFNTSKELIDYVIVHELAHLVQMNHSKKFHKVVEFYMPQAEEFEKKLQSFSL